MDLTTVPANTTAYREHRPPAGLASVVEFLWRREPWHPPAQDLGVLPDGRVDLIWAAGQVLVIGPQTRSLGRPAPPDVTVVGARFLPGLGPPLLGIPAHELADLHLPLAAIDTRPAAALLRELAALDDPAEASKRIVRAIARRTGSQRSWRPDPVVQRAVALLELPRARVASVADHVGLSERQLQRRFHEEVGYSPKTLQRVLRFRRLLEALGLGCRQTGGLGRIAVTVGYADQAHLTRETRELSGLSPVGLDRALRALEREGGSGIFKTGRRADGARTNRRSLAPGRTELGLTGASSRWSAATRVRSGR